MKEGVIAVVKGREITNAEFEAFVNALPQEQRAFLNYPGGRERFQEQYISLFTFAEEALEMGLDQTEEFARIMENTKRDLLAQMAMNKAIEAATVSDEEVKAYYATNEKKFQKQETVTARHILVDSEERCNVIKSAILDGTRTFEEAARECSSCPSGQDGGMLGEFGHGQMVKPFDEAAFEAPIGEVVGPVKTEFGYHLIKVEAKTEGGIQEFEEVKDAIYRSMLQKKQNEVYDAKVEELKEKYVEM